MGDMEPSSPDLLPASTSCKEALTSEINFLLMDISLIRHDMEKYHSKLSEAETRTLQVEDTVHTDSRQLKILQGQMQTLHERSVDMENRLHRSNLRVVGLPEWAEGAQPAEFEERFLTTLFDYTDFPPTFAVERAHRVSSTPPVPGQGPS